MAAKGLTSKQISMPTFPTAVGNGFTSEEPGSTELREMRIGTETAVGIDLLALSQNGATLNINIKEMDFLIPLGNISLFVDPQQSILQLLTAIGRFMYTDIDGNPVLLSCAS